ncbi:MAG: coproporphyrinogen oxidase [Pseudomonadota bacterium]|nr:coproporphyrinogen oxidase [Pseudomonadota bacterium]
MSYPALPAEAVSLIRAFLLEYQRTLCANMEKLDGKATFLQDHWQRSDGGGGISCVMDNGQIFERAGINFSHITGASLPPSATQSRPELAGKPYEALGVSIVFHPKNPFVPTTHANIRFFIAYDDNQNPIWWFGGGFDLTPFYPFEEDCIAWHKHAKNACHPFEDTLYPQWKEACDEYFYLKHRQETRGIGGLFFDDFNQPNFEQAFAVWKNVGLAFWNAYNEIVQKRWQTPFTQQHRDFQLYRRGRYVEFNLIYDRGTLFGLQSNGRTESILMSMPPEVQFKYNWQPIANSEEAKLYERYLKPQNWLNQ